MPEPRRDQQAPADGVSASEVTPYRVEDGKVGSGCSSRMRGKNCGTVQIT